MSKRILLVLSTAAAIGNLILVLSALFMLSIASVRAEPFGMPFEGLVVAINAMCLYISIRTAIAAAQSLNLL